MDVLIPLLLILAVVVGIPVAGWFIWLRYRERQRESWPITTATVETGNVEVQQQESALVSLALGHPTAPSPLVLILGYCFTANGSYYSGETALKASDYADAEWVVPELKGMKLAVRYDPGNPDSSFPIDSSVGGRRLLRKSAYSGVWIV